MIGAFAAPMDPEPSTQAVDRAGPLHTAVGLDVDGYQSPERATGGAAAPMRC